MLFNPAEELIKNSGATPALCVTEVRENGKVVLSIENHTTPPVTFGSA